MCIFVIQVILESLRMASIISYTFREAVVDVQYNGKMPYWISYNFVTQNWEQKDCFLTSILLSVIYINIFIQYYNRVPYT